MAAPPAFNAVVRHPSASLHGCCRRRLTEHRAHAPHTLPASLPVRPHAVLRTSHQHGVHAPWKHTGTHVVSQQRSLINEMVRSLLQASANQAGGHKSLPAGDAEGHRPLFMGNLSHDYPNRQRNMVTRTQLLCSHLLLLNLTAVANTSANVMKSQHQRTLHTKQHKPMDPLNILVSGRVSRLEALKPKTHQSCAQIRTSHLKRMMSFKYLHRIIPSILNTQDLISRIQQAWCFRSSVKHY